MMEHVSPELGPVSLPPGTSLGPYTITGPLGRGGMGEVYRARDTRLGREVAVKVLPSGLAGSPPALERFEREVRAVAALNHPNIVALHDVGSAAGVSYAVTELLDGTTLRDLVRAGGRLPPRHALEMAAQIARGLAAAHERGIVHRDLKAENVFVTRDGRVKILDFGIAVRDETHAGARDAETVARTEPGLLLGTLGYMAPEQIRGESISARADLFALGVLVHELLTGVNPFRRDTPADTMSAVLREPAPPLAVAAPGMPRAAARLIDRCLEKRPEDRPQSALDLAFALEALAGDAAEPAPAAGMAAPAVASVTAQPRRTAAAAAALLLAFVGAAWTYVHVSADRSVARILEGDLGRARAIVQRVHDERLERLQLTARLVASFPELKALFETNAPTIRDFLRAYQARNPGTPVLMALDASGRVLARTDEGTSEPDEGPRWLDVLLAPQAGGRIVLVDGRPWHAAAAGADAGGFLFGYVMAAAPVDGGFARALGEATEDEVVLLGQSLLGSTLRAGQVPWSSLDAWRNAGGQPGTSTVLTIGGTRFAARDVLLGDEPPVAAIVLKSRDAALEPFRRIESGMLWLGLAAAASAGWIWRVRMVRSAAARRGAGDLRGPHPPDGPPGL
jgi:hypothetical protein